VCGCRRRARTRRALVGTKVRHNCKARERARRRRQRHLQIDRLGSMAGSQATAGLRGGAMRDSKQHTNNELTRLGPASARRPGPHQGERGFSPRVLDTTAKWRGGVEEEDRGSACCRRSRAARSMASTSASPLSSSPAPWRPGEAANSSVKRKQGGSARRRGDLTTDGSGLGVGVLGSGRSGFAAATRGVASSGGLPAGRTATWGTSGATTAFSCTRRRRSSAAPPLLLLFFFSPWSFLFLPESAARAGAWRLRPPVHLLHSFPLPLPL
jgi:hypothetical protein